MAGDLRTGLVGPPLGSTEIRLVDALTEDNRSALTAAKMVHHCMVRHTRASSCESRAPLYGPPSPRSRRHRRARCRLQASGGRSCVGFALLTGWIIGALLVGPTHCWLVLFGWQGKLAVHNAGWHNAGWHCLAGKASQQCRLVGTMLTDCLVVGFVFRQWAAQGRQGQPLPRLGQVSRSSPPPRLVSPLLCQPPALLLLCAAR